MSRIKCRIALGFVALLVLSIQVPHVVHAQKNVSPSQDVTRSLTIVSVPGLSFNELQSASLEQTPELAWLIQNGVVGSLNMRTLGKTLGDEYLTLGAGVQAVSLPKIQGYQQRERMNGEPARDPYRRFTAYSSVPSSQEVQLRLAKETIVVPGIELLRQINSVTSYKAQPGTLGEILREHQIARYVWGNADRGSSALTEEKAAQRFAPLLLMAADGTVPLGDVSDRLLLANAHMSFGVQTDYTGILSQWKQRQGPSLTLIELGDFSRLYEEKPFYEEISFLQQKQMVLQQMDRFIGQLRRGLMANDTLWVFSPQVNSDAFREKVQLAPIIQYHEDVQPGIIVSASTRRLGVATAADFSASILAIYGLQAGRGWLGLPLQIEPRESALSWLLSEVMQISHVYQLRPTFLYTFAVYEIVIILIALAFIHTQWRKAAIRLKGFLYAILIGPMGMLCMGWIANLPIALQVAFFGLTLLGLCLFAVRYDLLTALTGIGSTVAMLILLDGWSGAYAMKRSVLGYDPLIGARYYGIGNEFMGVLIGAAILAISALLQKKQLEGDKLLLLAVEQGGLLITRSSLYKRKRYIAVNIAIIYFTILIYLAAPFWGANAGGAIAAAAAFGLAWLRMHYGLSEAATRWPRLLIMITLLILGGFALLWLLNQAAAAPWAQHSHVGRAMSQLTVDGGWSSIEQMAIRKLKMNVHLLAVSVWSKVLLSCLIVIVVIVLRPKGILNRWQRQYPYLMHGFFANTIGAIVALLFNDSGIVAAATMIVYVAVPMLLLKLDDMALN